MKPTICIVDDDQSQLEAMVAYINSNEAFENYVISTFSNSEAYGIEDKEYDLYFFDIDMPIVNGFELAAKIQKKYPEAIFLFVSSHNEFVYDSFKFSAFYFVRKDHFDTDMKEALVLALEKVEKKDEKYIAEFKGNKVALRYSDILYFEKAKNKLFIATMEHGDLHEIKTIKALVQELDFKRHNFCMINAGTCVNLRCIIHLNGLHVYMKNNTKLVVSRRYATNLKNEYQKCLMESDA